MPLLIYDAWYTVEAVRNEPQRLFIFGDNTARIGKGGQAIIRDEPNALGVATKWFPGSNQSDYFADGPAAEIALDTDLAKVETALCAGKTVYFPRDGIGTGLSDMPRRAPMLFAYMDKWFKDRLKK